MKHLLKIFILFSLSVSLFSCENAPSGTDSKANDDIDHLGEEEVASNQNTDAEIELNDGEKWEVNAEMKPHIAQGESAVDDFLSSTGKKEVASVSNKQSVSTRSGYKELAKELEIADKALISSCTMNGKSHDELHKWLHPHLELVADLGEAKSPSEAHLIIKKIDKSYERFWDYFQ